MFGAIRRQRGEKYLAPMFQRIGPGPLRTGRWRGSADQQTEECLALIGLIGPLALPIVLGSRRAECANGYEDQ